MSDALRNVPLDRRHLVSPKSYVLSVVLCSLTGILGLHFFYMGRHGYGCFDLGMSIAAGSLLVTGRILEGLAVLAVDYLHSVIMTFRLLTGSEVDGEGRRIIYPGQKL